MVLALGYGGYVAGYWPLPGAASVDLPAALAAEQAPPERLHHIRAEAKVTPMRRAELSVPLAGIVQEIYVQEGDQVGAGQLLLKLKDAQYRSLVDQATAALKRASAAHTLLVEGARPEDIAELQAAVDAAKANYDKLANGLLPSNIKAAEAAVAQVRADYTVVQQGAPQTKLLAAEKDVADSEAELNQAQAAFEKVRNQPDASTTKEALALATATAQVEAAKTYYDALFRSVTPAQIAGAAAAVDVAQARLAALTDALPGELAEADALVRQAQAQLEKALAGSRRAEIVAAAADVELAVAILQHALINLADTELRAPFTGTVTLLNTEIGEQVSTDVPVLQLADTTAWQFETLDLNELDVVGLTPGLPVTVTVDAIPGLELPATVARIRPVGENSLALALAADTPAAELQAGDTSYRVIVTPARY